MKRAKFVAAARREFLFAVAYYNKEEPGLGARFSAAVEDATARALAFLLAGAPTSKNTRRVFVKEFPVFVAYRPDADGIIIFALAHHSRRPNYWQSRVQDRQQITSADLLRRLQTSRQRLATDAERQAE